MNIERKNLNEMDHETIHMNEIKKCAKRHDKIFIGCSFGHAEISYNVFCRMIDKYCRKNETVFVSKNKFDSQFGGLFIK